MKKHAILVVDDEIDNVDALERLFRKKYQVFKATSGDEGLGLLKKHRVALIISDQRMPNMSGVDFLKKSIDLDPDAIRILLTGYTDIDSVINAINAGQVYRYVTKPWDPVDLENAVDKAIEKYDLRFELREKNEQLKKALDELKTLDKAKNHFMVLINHELKTPLTVMLSFLELMAETNLDSDQSTYVDRIQKSADRLKKLIEDVLELVSAETGQLKVSLKKVNIKKLLGPLDADLLKRAEENEQTISVDSESLSVKADQKILNSIVHRLVENAVKFGDKKSTIKVQGSQEDGSDKVAISVTNKGKGLPKATINKILKPFALDEDVMHHSEGSGLGLSVCQSLLRTHESKLEFAGSKGEVTVKFQLDA